MDDAAVVAGLVKGQAVFGLEHQAAQTMVDRESARRGEADDPAADHDDIEGAHPGEILAYRPMTDARPPRIPGASGTSNALLHCPTRLNLLQ